MYAMQYEITLPAGYDTGLIRQRVATKAPLLDHFEGLGLKAYLLREQGVEDSPVNCYAPFYLWASTAAMGRFLWGGGGFGNIVSFVGRAPVRHWTGVACLPGGARGQAPVLATRSVEPMAEGDPQALVAQALQQLRRRADHPAVHTTALAVDPLGWSMVHFTLWRERVPEATGTRFQVLHLSTPHLHELPQELPHEIAHPVAA
jgi:hypothetical protein